MTWLTLSLLAAFFASLVAIFGKIGIKDVDSTMASMVRAAIMFVVLLGFTIGLGKLPDVRTLTGKSLTFIILAGVAGALSWIFYFWALKVGEASKVAPIDRMSLVFVVLIAAVFLGEKLGIKGWIGAALMIGGAVLLALP